MSLPNLYLGDDLVINGVNISFNNANVTVKAPLSALNVSNKNYVDVADASLNTLIATASSVRSSEDAKIILIANRDNQEIKIALASNFKIAEIDIFRLKNLHKDLIIKSIN